MKFSLWTQNGALNSKPVFEAFKQGALSLGHTCVENSTVSDVDVIWSMLWAGRMRNNQQIWQRAQLQQRPVIVLEVGGLRRGTTWRIGVDGVNGAARFGATGNNSNRAHQLGLALSDWCPNITGPIVICTQHTQSQQWINQPAMHVWLDQIISDVRAVSQRPIVIRPHPRCALQSRSFAHSNVNIQTPQRRPGTYDDYDFAVTHAWAVINWSSNPAVEAVRKGIPVFVGPDSLAWPVGNHSVDLIESPLMPDRTQWLNDLAHTEWTLNEIAQGMPIKQLTNELL